MSIPFLSLCSGYVWQKFESDIPSTAGSSSCAGLEQRIQKEKKTPQCRSVLQNVDRKSVRLLCRPQNSFQAEQVLRLPVASPAVIFNAAGVPYFCLQIGFPMELRWVQLSRQGMCARLLIGQHLKLLSS